ncbi:MAG: protein kinase [Candidatus Wallbacteria bacterium]|nr:protein kinase [Candidatus Wallbacteria bacterium]
MADDKLPPAFGRYEVTGSLGAGGMGVVLRGFDPKLKREVAIKVLPKRLKLVPTFEERFKREALTLGRVSHPNVVRIFDVGEDWGLLYYVMEFLEGKPLDKRTDALEESAATSPPPFEPKEFLELFTPLADALAAVHAAGIVHRDIKPANIFSGIAERGAVLTDFGLIWMASDDKLTQEGTIMGTGHYMAPEQVMGTPPDALCDIYGLGSAMWEYATGRVPFNQIPGSTLLAARMTAQLRPLKEAVPAVPDAIASVVDQCVKLSPQERFQTAKELHRALVRAARPPRESAARAGSASAGRLPARSLSSLQQTASPSTTQLATPTSSRRWLPLAVLALAGLGGGLTGVWMREGRTPPPAAAALQPTVPKPPSGTPAAGSKGAATPPAQKSVPEEPVRLTGGGEQGRRVVLARPGTALVVAWVRPDGKILVRRAASPGASWEEPSASSKLTASPATELAMVATGDRVHLLFTREGSDGRPWVYLVSSASSCQEWTSPRPLGRASGFESRLLIQARPGRSHAFPLLAAWDGPRGEFPTVTWSSADGTIWTTPAALPGRRPPSRLAALLPATGPAALVWTHNDPASDSRHLVISRSAGPEQEWSTPGPLIAESAGFDRHSAAAAVAGQLLYLFWAEDRVAAKPLVLALSTDGGTQFRQHGPLLYPYCKDGRSVVTAWDNRVWCVWWVSYREELVWVTSRDGGRNWTKPRALDTMGKSSVHACVVAGPPGDAWIAWSNSAEEVRVARLP